MTRITQRSFAGGEIAPSLHNRVDLAKYQTALAKALNAIIHTEGGVSNRSGTQFIAEVKDSTKKTRLIEFEFNVTQAYALEFGDQYLRVIKDAGQVLDTSKAITSITKANPAVVTSASHGYSNGDEVYIDTGGDMVEVNGRNFLVANVATNTFELRDLNNVAIDSTSYTTYTGGGTVSKIYEISTPYLEADLFDLKYTQSADVMTIVEAGYDPRELTRSGHASWTLGTISFAVSQGPPTGLSLGTIGTASGSNNKTYEYVVTAVNDAGEESLPSTAANHSVNALSTTYGSQLTWTAPASGTIQYYNIYKAESHNADVYGLIGTSNTTTFDDYNIAPDMGFGPPSENEPFTGAGNKPSAVNYYQQRIVYAAPDNNPQTVYLSESGNYKSMRKHTPVIDSDAIQITIASKKVNQIRHMVSLDSMVILTSGGEWLVTEGSNEVITPSTIGVNQQSYNGSANIEPVIIDNTALYVQDKGTRVRDLSYSFESDAYVGNDLTILARHLFKTVSETYTVVDWAYQKEPYGILWVVRSDGTLLSFTYQREHQVYAWTKHSTGASGLFESVCVVPEGDEDAVYFIVKRIINGNTKRYIERLHTRQMPDITDAFFVDCGLTYDVPITITGATAADPVVITASAHGLSDGDQVLITDVSGMTELNNNRYLVANSTTNTFELTDLQGDNIDGSAYTAYESGGEVRLMVNTISNLGHLEGEDVIALADGAVIRNLTVSGGEVTLEVKAAKIHIGLSYTSDIETLDIDSAERTQRGVKKNVAEVTYSFQDSRGGWAGYEFSDTTMIEMKPRFVSDGYDTIPLRTFDQTVSLNPKWSEGGHTCFRQKDPLPFTILSITPNFDVA